MNKQLSNEDLMDIIMSYDRYVQQQFDLGLRPNTIADFYESNYAFYTTKKCSKYLN